MTQPIPRCVHCSADLQGPPIAEEYREFYSPETTHYSRLIGVEVQGVYDGVLFWQCPDCGGRWHRWGTWSPNHAKAEPYVRGDFETNNPGQ